ncbi:MAG: YebC/PmpR family DNA-binding transcriptional regulator [Chlamydiia bacterium]|nr:YebC/PmpR family DNA-binding transcriptional regulator [Chlamydiia bacterium]
MAGHSKWANTKHRKERADAKKGKIFSRIAKEIATAVKLGGADSKGNPRLRLALQQAKEVNMPLENCERLIKKASGGDQADYFELVYELYGHGGVGILVEIMTDNKNRTSSDMRIATNKRGGSIATPGAVSFNFDRRGVILFKKGTEQSSPLDEDALFLAATDAGALDVETGDEECVVLTEPTDLCRIREALQEAGFVAESADLVRMPKNMVECDEETLQANHALIEWLENIDDVDEVYHNMAEPESV